MQLSTGTKVGRRQVRNYLMMAVGLVALIIQLSMGCRPVMTIVGAHIILQ